VDESLEIARAARRDALGNVMAGIAFADIPARLRASGYSEAIVARVMPVVASEVEQAYRNNTRRSLTFGLGIIGACILISIYSFVVFGFTGAYIFWGIVALGGALVVRGLIFYRRLRLFQSRKGV
jgi:hypothetical protein